MFLIRAPSRFELILSAETLYSPESCCKLMDAISSLLSDSGIAIIASKRYYFGVGGGTQELARICASYSMSMSIARVFEDGVSNIREIVTLTRVT